MATLVEYHRCWSDREAWVMGVRYRAGDCMHFAKVAMDSADALAAIEFVQSQHVETVFIVEVTIEQLPLSNEQKLKEVAAAGT